MPNRPLTFDQLQALPQEKVDRLILHLDSVSAMLKEDGAKILPHLCDTDDNEGQRLRESMHECCLLDDL